MHQKDINHENNVLNVKFKKLDVGSLMKSFLLG
jgi:hypothetical protein